MKLFPILLAQTYLYLIIGAGALVLLALIITIIVCKKRKAKRKEFGSDFGQKVLESLGDCENIVKIKLERRRLTVEVKDLNLLKPKQMRELKLGAIITRNQIKMLIKDSPREVYKYIQQKRKGV